MPRGVRTTRMWEEAQRAVKEARGRVEGRDYRVVQEGGKKVAIIERGPSRDSSGVRQGGGFGGTCVNVGCVPKKLFAYGAGFPEEFELAASYG